MDRKSIQYRLSNDFQLAILTLLGIIALIGITPFAVYRAITGQWGGAALDLTILMGISINMLRAWHTGNAQRASVVQGYFIGAMAVAAAFILGRSGQYWMYPAIIANFFLVDPRRALSIALLAIAILLLSGRIDLSVAEGISFAITVAVCALLGYAFAHRTAVQRRQLEALATKDALTGAFNRHALIKELERAGRLFARDSQPRGLLVFDLDHFKRINDQLGHIAGDQVLIRFAHRLERSSRPGDVLFRFGGEEFVFLVAPPVTIEALAAMSDHLRLAVEDEFRKDRMPLTVSVGGAMLRPSEAVTDRFARADTALYQAKNSGRNRAIIDPGG